jgi:predicted small lipoprotein YifL
MSRRTGVIVGVLLAMVMSVSGCKAKAPLVPPSEAEAKAAISRKLGSVLKLVDFKTTSTLTDEPRKLCKIGYECEIEVTQDCRYMRPFRTYADEPDTKPQNLFDLPPAGDPVKQGERMKIKGAILFEYAGNGWTATKVAGK